MFIYYHISFQIAIANLSKYQKNFCIFRHKQAFYSIASSVRALHYEYVFFFQVQYAFTRRISGHRRSRKNLGLQLCPQCFHIGHFHIRKMVIRGISEAKALGHAVQHRLVIMEELRKAVFSLFDAGKVILPAGKSGGRVSHLEHGMLPIIPVRMIRFVNQFIAVVHCLVQYRIASTPLLIGNCRFSYYNPATMPITFSESVSISGCAVIAKSWENVAPPLGMGLDPLVKPRLRGKGWWNFLCRKL